MEKSLIVLIDDDQQFRVVVSDLLRRQGFGVLEASDGAEGVALVAGSGPALVVTDLHMPVMDGIEVVRAIRANPATTHVPVLLLTGDRSEEARAAAEAAGCDRFLAKPLTIRELLDAVAAAVSGAGVPVSPEGDPGYRG